MAKTFFEVIAAKGGIAGEYEALTEAEIAAAPGAAYTPPESGNFRVVASRVVQLLADSPIYIETFQTSAATLRVPSGSTSTNDAEDGRLYFIRNANTATGALTIQNSSGTILGIVNPGDLVIIIHGENNTWDVTDPISSTGSGSSDLRNVFIHDHFLSGNADTDEMGLMGWRLFVTGTGAVITFTGEADHPGIIVLNAGTSSTARCAVALGDSSGVGSRVVLGGTNPINLEFLFKFPDATSFDAANLESVVFGFGLDWTQDAELTNGLFVRYGPASPISDTTYKLVAVTSSTSTVLSSTVVPAAATWVKFNIIYTPSSGLATLIMNGTAVSGSISTNIPSAGMGIGMKMRSVGSGAGVMGYWDYVLGTQDIN